MVSIGQQFVTQRGEATLQSPWHFERLVHLTGEANSARYPVWTAYEYQKNPMRDGDV
jgi:hypothetical protein